MKSKRAGASKMDNGKSSDYSDHFKNKETRSLSIRDVFKFSLTSHEIRILFEIEPWRFISFYFFKECYPEGTFSFEELSMNMPNFDPGLVDVIMKGEDTKILSKKHKKKLSAVLKGEESEDSLVDFRSEFKYLMENVIHQATLEKINLGNIFLARIINKILDQEVSPESMDSKKLNNNSVTITFLKNKERLDWQYILKECPLCERCRRIVEIFSKEKKSRHLSCLQCPQLILAKSRLRKEILTRDQSNLNNYD